MCLGAARGAQAQPVLFLDGAWDPICGIADKRLGEPMCAACWDLSLVTLPGGHWLMLQQPVQVNEAMSRWLERAVGI